MLAVAHPDRLDQARVDAGQFGPFSDHVSGDLEEIDHLADPEAVAAAADLDDHDGPFILVPARLLKEEGGALLAAVLREGDWPPSRPEVRAAAADVAGYLERNAHRAEYPEYEAEGWYIGSGVTS